jgi:hypothetical protein
VHKVHFKRPNDVIIIEEIIITARCLAACQNDIEMPSFSDQ